MSVDIHEYPDRSALAEALADSVVTCLKAAIRDHGVAHLAVSGGGTPRVFFRALARRTCQWDKVCVTLVDERWVPESDERSNARAVRELLLQDRAATAEFQPLYSGTKTPEQGITSTVRLAGGIAYALDVAILGMGLDGHTASLFPGASRLAEALDPATKAIFLPISAPHLDESRMTMTLPILLNAGALYLHIEGADKRAVLDRALAGTAVEEMPVRALINHDDKPVAVYWAP